MSRGLGDVYKRQVWKTKSIMSMAILIMMKMMMMMMMVVTVMMSVEN